MSENKKDPQNDGRKAGKRAGFLDILISLPEPFIFVTSLAASIYFLFRHSYVGWDKVWLFAGALNGTPNLSDLIVVFIPACITAFGSMYLVSRSAVLGIRDEKLRSGLNSISFLIMLAILFCLFLLVDDFRDSLTLCSSQINSGGLSDNFQCGAFSEYRILILNSLFFIITSLTFISMGLSKFIVIALKDR